MKWTVEALFTYGWDNASWQDEEGKPLVYDSKEEANKAIDEFIQDVHEAVLKGDMDSEVNREEYRAVPVKEAK